MLKVVWFTLRLIETTRDVYPPRCGIAEKSLHVICISLNNERLHCITPRSLKKNFYFSAIPHLTPFINHFHGPASNYVFLDISGDSQLGNVYPLFFISINETNKEHNTQKQKKMVDPEETLLKNPTHKHFDSPCPSLPTTKSRRADSLRNFPLKKSNNFGH